MVRRYIFVLVDTILGIIEFLLGLRILLKLLGASTAAPFVTWVYQTTQSLLTPFEGIFPSPVLPSGSVLEMSALFALVVYAFVGFLLESAISHLSSTYIVHED